MATDAESGHAVIRLTGESKLDKARLDKLFAEIREVYLGDGRPWVIGYSGGKDSTTALQLVWYALAGLPAERRIKPVYVISSDTLVESPVIVAYIDGSLAKIEASAKAQGLPIHAAKVQPLYADSFWVNMIGRGYPAPYKRFRWCTDRLKIQPANRFILERVAEFGEVVLVLGVRRAESATRAQVMNLHKRNGEHLSRHSDLTNAWVYTPIEDFSLDDVWTYLLSAPNPWGAQNRDLVTMYRNAQAGECPLVVDKTTPSCGNSRFGCWTCTVVERDKSMEAMIENGEEWMEPLLELRDFLASTQDPAKKRAIREVQRRDGRIRMWGENQDQVIWGPFKLEFRKDILRRVLDTQKAVRRVGPDPQMDLIRAEELHEIRKLWRTQEGDWEDSLPRLYREVTGEAFTCVPDDGVGTGALELNTLREVCEAHGVPTRLVTELVDIERELNGMGRRSSIYGRIGDVFAKDWRSVEEVLGPEVEESGAS